MARFKILGSAAGTGVPSFFCDCAGCREARMDARHSRTRSEAVLHTDRETILIDASPDLRWQLEKAQIAEFDQLFLTHWHYDHFGGLGELEFYIRLQRRQVLPLYLPPSAVALFADAFPHLEDVFEIIPWQFHQRYRFGGADLTPLPANHGIETAGLLIETPQSRLAYFTDTAGLPAETAAKVHGVDWLICDATFYGENWYPHSHMSVAEAIDFGRRLEAKNTVLTHLAIHYSQPVTAAELEREAARQPGVRVAYDGMCLDI